MEYSKNITAIFRRLPGVSLAQSFAGLQGATVTGSNNEI
jgi:hypothetical protein